MTNSTKKRFSLVLMFVAILAFALTFGITLSDGSALAAAESASTTSTISVGHISDIHYFPIYRCYRTNDAEEYAASEFFFSMTGDMKLVEESASVFDSVCEEYYLDAKAGKAPKYIVVSGDLCKNGEHDALIDVANRLRLLQNDIRALGTKGDIDYSEFQIFVLPGNHDLYNGAGAYYKTTDGASYKSDTVSAADFALMFNALGYPQRTLAELTSYLDASYWNTQTEAHDTAAEYGMNAAGKGSGSTAFTGAYVESTTSTSCDITYYESVLNDINDGDVSKYAQISGNQNCLSFYTMLEDNFVLFGIDATYRLAESGVTFVPELNDTVASGKSYYEFVENEGLKAISDSAAQTKIDEGKVVYYDANVNHSTGGRITVEVLDWMQSVIEAASTNDGVAEVTAMATFHQNVVPHWEQEDEILKDFTLYNWEYVATRLLDMGLRYTYTGHMHANDIAYYTDAEGRTLYDLETGSLASYDAPVRYTAITRYNADGKLAETFDSDITVLDEFAFDKNGDGTIGADETFKYNTYSNDVIYKVLLVRLVDHFISNETIDGLLDSVYAMLDAEDPQSTINTAVGGILSSYAPVIDKMARSLIDQVFNDLDFTYDGTTYDNIIDYLGGIIDVVVNWQFGNDEIGKFNVAQIVGFVAQAHNAGLEITTDMLEGKAADYAYSTESADYVKDSPTDPMYRARYIAAVQDLHKQCKSGKFVEDLLGLLLDPIYYDDNSILKQLLTHKFDFSEAITTDEDKESFNDLIDIVSTLLAGMAGVDELTFNISIDNFVLGDILDSIFPVLSSILADSLGFTLSGTSVTGALDTFLGDYLVDSFYVGIGGIADTIAMAFVTDDMPDYADPSDASKPLRLAAKSGTVDYANVKFTYMSGTANAVEATQLNGKQPSTIIKNFATNDNATTTYSFSYYTKETVFTQFDILNADGTVFVGANTNKDFFALAASDLNADGLYQVDGTATANGVTVSIKTVATPSYIPLIDLGLACLSHGAIYSDEDETVACKASDRDLIESNSVLYWNRHIVTISGLSAGTTYTYRVAGTYVASDASVKQFWLGGNTADGKNAKTYTFATAAAANTDTFSFLAIADNQGMTADMYAQTNAVLEAISANEAVNDYDFVLGAGDMADNGKNFYQYQYAFNNDFFANTSFFMTAGNHEGGSYALSRFFNYNQPTGYAQTGETGVYYSFNYGTAHFVVLDTNDADAKDGLGAKQLEWLKADLAAANANANNDWTFVIMHKSLYSAGSHNDDGEVVKMRAQLVPIFADNNVDIVFGGHDHTYTVTNRLDKDGKETNDMSGVTYITLGTIGTKFYEYAENDDVTPRINADESIMNTIDSQTFGYVKVNGSLVEFLGYQYDKADGSLRLISDVGAVADDVVAQKVDAIVNAANGGYGNSIETSWFARNTKGAYSSANLPAGYSFVFVADGKEYKSMDDITIVAGQNTMVKVFLLDTASGVKVQIDTVTLSVANYVLGIVLWTVIPALAIIAAVAVLLVLKKKKVGAKATCANADKDDTADNSADAEKDETVSVKENAAADVQDDSKKED